MKLLFVLDHYYPYIGGAEEISRSLAESFVRRGCEVTVITSRHDSTLPEYEVIGGVKVERISGFGRFSFSLFAFGRILRHAAECDLIHTAPYFAALPAWLAARLKGKKIAIVFYEVWGGLWWKLPFLNPITKAIGYVLERALLKLPFSRFIAGSNFTAHKLLKAGTNPTAISRIYFGLDYQEFKDFHHQAPKQFSYTFFGRLGVTKGIDLLIDAAEKFQANFPDARLHLIIPRTPRRLLRQVYRLIDEKNLRPHVRISHDLSRRQLFHELSRTSCVVIPSLSEGFGFAALESVAIGVPIIASQRGSLNEVVSGTHLLLKSVDSEEIYHALVQARAGHWCFSPTKRFELTDTVESFHNLYQQLVTGTEPILSEESSFVIGGTYEDSAYRRSPG